MNQYKELKDSFLLLKAQINALCASNSSSNEDNYRELRRATDDFEAFLFHRFVDFEKICDNLPDAIYIADKEGRMKVLSSSPVHLPSDLDYAKYIEGMIEKKDDIEFAFLKSGSVNCFVSPSIIRKYNLKNGDKVNSLIVYDYDKKKEAWNWVCVNITK